MKGSRTRYTERGISRVPCARCGAPSQFQWNACALGDRYFGVCLECDIGLNRAALAYMRVPDAESIIAAYRKQKERAP